MVTLVRHRELLESLVVRDLKSRYKQAALGVLWAVLQPLAMMLVFTLALSRFIPSPDPRVPYGIFVFSGLLPWNFLAASLNFGSNSLVNNATLLKKIYLPREVFPVSAVLAGLVDLLLGLVVLLILTAVYGIPPGWGLLALPAVLFLEVVLATGVALALGTANLFFRDVKHVLPVVTILWMFLTPVVYPLSQMSPRAQAWLKLNPATFLVDTFRSCLLGLPLPGPAEWLGAAALCGAVLLLGWVIFRRCEPAFAEIV